MVFRDSQLNEEPVADGSNGLPMGTNTAIVTDYDMSPICDFNTLTVTRAPFNLGIEGAPLMWYATAIVTSVEATFAHLRMPAKSKG